MGHGVELGDDETSHDLGAFGVSDERTAGVLVSFKLEHTRVHVRHPRASPPVLSIARCGGLGFVATELVFDRFGGGVYMSRGHLNSERPTRHKLNALRRKGAGSKRFVYFREVAR